MVIDHTIGAYQLFVYSQPGSSPLTDGKIAQITLTLVGLQYSAVINFYSDPTKIQANTLVGNLYTINSHISQYEKMVDILRNESPTYLVTTLLQEARIRTD